MSEHVKQQAFSESERDIIYRVIHARRDMRHFSGGSVEAEALARILAAGHAAPSVGFMQPWRFVRITSNPLREQLVTLVEQEKLRTSEQMDARKAEFMRLKVEGIRDCAELIAVVLAPDDGTLFGRRTMPEEMALCSTSCAIENMWLAARAENLGMGWVSFFEPGDVATLLNCPEGSKPIALLCLGPVKTFYDKPLLESEGWRNREAMDVVLAEDSYPL
ncbi:5,6-dimethylbenzimidazole synthase [Mariprofundus sp. KV]|uniref:5,6-dimethylbenzimidazole synthase n=1 Tax=Mariprofundus sp. KV TaxID=2608715 RepID=UPI0015A070FE|nr:5,6-dimethylbenzimidazole synthase [Mariprofundus sp. KV]NWF36723.1 5,6-dimethylbenzimidazole synthase [Mariprofundus sp. KV]